MRRGPPWVLIILLALVGGCCATSLIYYAIGERHPPVATEVTPTPTVFYYPSPTARPRPTLTPTPALALTFTEALASGHITATAQGAGLEAVRIAMRRLSDVNMAISIPIGTFFVNRGDAQDMVAVSPTTVLLADSQAITAVVQCACANLYRSVPGIKSTFDILASPQQEELAQLLATLDKAQPKHVVKQVAVWIVTDNVTRSKLDERYVRRSIFNIFGGTPAASDEDVVRAIFLVNAAGIDLSTKAIYTERVSLFRALGSGEAEVRREAMGLLDVTEQEILPYLLASLEDQSPQVRRSAAYALGKRGDERAIAPLSRLLEDEDPVTRQETVRALTDLHAVDVFTQTLKSPDLNLRLDSVQALAEIGEKRAVPSVIEALDDQDPRVRAAAAVCLATLADPRAITALNARLEREEDAAVIEAMRSALEAFQQP